MPRLDESADPLIQALEAHYGPRRAAPEQAKVSQTLFERLAHILLERVASTQVASAAYTSLQAAGMLNPVTLAQTQPLELDDLLKHDGIAMAIQSVRPLQKLARWVSEQVGDLDLAEWATRPTAAIRADWAEINGLGLATVDALLLLGLKRVAYPVDRATYRIFVRHGWLDPTADYDEARATVERLPEFESASREEASSGDLGEAAAALVLIQLQSWFARVGREYCKPSRTFCERCPLVSVLPPGGPVEVE